MQWRPETIAASHSQTASAAASNDGSDTCNVTTDRCPRLNKKDRREGEANLRRYFDIALPSPKNSSVQTPL